MFKNQKTSLELRCSHLYTGLCFLTKLTNFCINSICKVFLFFMDSSRLILMGLWFFSHLSFKEMCLFGIVDNVIQIQLEYQLVMLKMTYCKISCTRPLKIPICWFVQQSKVEITFTSSETISTLKIGHILHLLYRRVSLACLRACIICSIA